MALTPQSQASFIPKSALERPTERTSNSTSLLLVISLVLVMVSGIVLGGALLYKSVLDNEINASCGAAGQGEQRCGLKATVERERRNIDQITIRALQRLDKKLSAVDKLVAQHKDLLRVFRLLEQNTLASVSYSSFSYGEKGMSLNGQAMSYEDVAIQTKIFDEAKRQNQIQEFMFSDLDADDKGLVKFKLTIVINPTLILAQTPIQ